MTADASTPSGLKPLQDAVTMWALGCDGSAPSILAAARCLADGFDSPGLREVAGLPLETSWWTSRDLLSTAFVELGVEFPEEDAPSTKLRGLRIMCARYLNGGITAETLTAWTHSLVGHESGDDLADDLVLLEDTDDYMAERPDDWFPRVRRAAEALVARG